MNKKDLVALLADKTGLKQYEVKKVIESFSATIVEKMEADEKIRMKGFGMFYPVFHCSRPVRNPKTGEEMDLVPRNSFKFRPGDDVVRKLNKSSIRSK